MKFLNNDIQPNKNMHNYLCIADTYKMCMYLEIRMQNKKHLQNRKYAVVLRIAIYPHLVSIEGI